MRTLSVCSLFCSLIVFDTAVAAPIELDTSGAHIVVIRPIDSWTGSQATSAYSLDDIRAKRGQFTYVGQDGRPIKVFRNEGIFPWSKTLPDDELTREICAGIRQHNFTFNGQNFLTIGAPVTALPAQMQALTEAQRALFEKVVTEQGDPATLQDVKNRQRWGSALIAAALLHTSVEHLGAMSGTNFALSSGVATDLNKLTGDLRKAVVAAAPSAIDYSGYKSVDIRSVTDSQKDRVGQIIIAYRGEKSAEAEREALAKAIVTAVGADTTVDQVEAARVVDRADRQAIWDRCVASGKCISN
jgi:hypothetical protein